MDSTGRCEIRRMNGSSLRRKKERKETGDVNGRRWQKDVNEEEDQTRSAAEVKNGEGGGWSF
uniref:Uncharacterized protein n=1 Tax=Cucumis melo TaxID=3656 RepID=A0A9I9D9D7_CUCME